MHPFDPDPPTGTTTAATPHPRRWQRRAGAALATLLLLGLSQAPAWAHDRLLSSTPADSTRVTALPPEIVLTLSEAPLATGAQVVITAADGTMLSTGPASVDDATVTVPVTGQGPAGAYTVAWHVVSSDGHPIEGAFEFVLEPTTETSPSPTPVQTGPDTESIRPGSTGVPTAPPAMQGQAAAADSSDSGRTSDPLVVVAVGIAVAVAILVLVTYLTRRRADAPGPAESVHGADTPE